MAYCSGCGAELIGDAEYCSKCGKHIGVAFGEDEHKGHRCPACGEHIGAFCLKCPTCGEEIRVRKASASVAEFSRKLELASTEEQKIDLIKGYIVPNTKEDIFEFMMLAVSMFDMDEHISKLDIPDISDAWLTKIEQCYQKAKLVFDDSIEFARIKEMYDKIQDERSKRVRNKRKFDIILGAAKAFLHKHVIIASAAALLLVGLLLLIPHKIKVGCTEADLVGKSEENAIAHFEDRGFKNITTIPVYETEVSVPDGAVLDVTINGEDDFSAKDKYWKKAQIQITYYEAPVAVGVSPTDLENKLVDSTVAHFTSLGFFNIQIKGYHVEETNSDEKTVSHVEINGSVDFDSASEYPKNANIVIYQRVGLIAVKMSAKELVNENLTRNRDCDEVVALLQGMGFTNITTLPTKKNVFHREGAVKSVSIGGIEDFGEEEKFYADVQITVVYYSKNA